MAVARGDDDFERRDIEIVPVDVHPAVGCLAARRVDRERRRVTDGRFDAIGRRVQQLVSDPAKSLAGSRAHELRVAPEVGACLGQARQHAADISPNGTSRIDRQSGHRRTQDLSIVRGRIPEQPYRFVHHANDARRISDWLRGWRARTGDDRQAGQQCDARHASRENRSMDP